jgi:hypothetical protein
MVKRRRFRHDCRAGAAFRRHSEFAAMPANVFRFDEHWDLPGATVAEVYDVLAHGERLPQWWRGVYLDAAKLSDNPEPRVGDRLRARARGALPYELNFILEATALDPDRRVQVRTFGDFDGVWTATLSQIEAGVRVDLVWEVTVLRPILKRLAPLLRPLFAWNHRWTTPRGEQGLKAYLAERRRSAA